MRFALPSSRRSIASYYQLAIVVPLVAIVLLAGGVGAVVNGRLAAGLAAEVIGLVLVWLIVRFVRLPVRIPDENASPTKP
jgi:hypothetical protein